MTEARYPSYESGEHIPPSDKLVKIAGVLKVSVEEVWGGRRYNEEGIPMLDISDGQVARRQLFSRVNDNCMTVSLEGIQFNMV